MIHLFGVMAGMIASEMVGMSMGTQHGCAQMSAKRLTCAVKLPYITGNTPAMPLVEAHSGGFFMPVIRRVLMQGGWQ
ncbi:MAG: hypothetical protein ACRC9V_05615 [Aeromonas sp.]